MITNRGYCNHVNGGVPQHCYRAYRAQSSCERYCTSQMSCIGYSYYTQGNHGCYLLQASYYSSCPSGFAGPNSGLIATSKNDLVGYSSSNFVCYVKNSGK